VITILWPGPLTTVQDLGRPGYGRWGIVPGGAADRGSLRLANRLVGNAEGAAALEITGGGFRARFSRPSLIAVAGALAPLTVAGRAFAVHAPVHVPGAAEVVVGHPSSGVRSYLAVRGGIGTPPVLGSRSTDLVAGLGNGRLEPGDELPIGAQATHHPNVDLAPVAGRPDRLVLTLIKGPRDDWFTPEALNLLRSTPYIVSPESDRIGIRFSGLQLRRSIVRELPSEPVMRGAVEVPPDGQPIMFLADHPTTCGYPIVAVAEPGSTDIAAQLRPGDRVHFRLTAPAPMQLGRRNRHGQQRDDISTGDDEGAGDG
jgi:biotin-dependent carboxylase-like uncharacterized protein